jgi:S1-C subfamily serine protease
VIEREKKLETNQTLKKPRLSTTFIVIVILASLMIGGILGYSANYMLLTQNSNDLQKQVSVLQSQVSALQSGQNSNAANNVYLTGENASLAQLYAQIKDSVVIVRGLIITYDMFHRSYYSQIQGSGFVYDYAGEMVIITNYHVIEDVINITVTFINGNGYPATVLGSDPYADLAVLSATAPESEFSPLEMVRSSTLNVGDPLIAIGNPYELAGSMTTGIVSALGRTITEDLSGGYPIADVIQTSTPINSGNSGGPLINYQGQVVGITTAIVSDSQGLGFAIPSSTVLKEIGSLIANGSYDQHSTIGASGTDMTYEIAQKINTDMTYGWLITQVTGGGPADQAGLKGGTQQVVIGGQNIVIGGDVIIEIDGTRIRNMDDMSSYLEANTLPGQIIDVTIVRNGEVLTLSLTLGNRPAIT